MKYKVLLILMLVNLVGCVTAKYAEIKKDYKPNDEKAIVIIGVYGIGSGWTDVKSSWSRTSLLRGPVFQEPDYKIPERPNEVFALQVNIGEIFTIKEVGVGRLKVEFENTLNLEIGKPGIYYYGSIINKGNSRIIMTHRLSKEVKHDIQKKYNDLIKKLKPINFKI